MPFNKKFLAVLGIVVVVAASAATTFRRQTDAAGGQSAKRAAHLPVADYASTDAPNDPRGRAGRKAKSSRFNGRGEVITELPDGVEQLPTINHWWAGLSALPVAQSSVVVLGKVTDARAFLSGDKTDVYSEFTFQIEEVIKGDGSAALVPGASITADRRGGGVRFPSGRIQRHAVAGMHLPEADGRYVLFLKSEGAGQDFVILTGYELGGGKVSALDATEVVDERTKLPFSVYEGKSEVEFLQAVRDAVGRAASGEVK
jgi:hypothetical protein